MLDSPTHRQNSFILYNAGLSITTYHELPLVRPVSPLVMPYDLIGSVGVCSRSATPASHDID